MLVAAARTKFGERLRELREAAGVSQYALAKRSTVTAQAISRLEKAEREPNWLTVVLLARALGVAVGDFDTGETVAELTAPDTPPTATPRSRRKK
jgi:transcriptional regulator with XRE-family HTH domain